MTASEPVREALDHLLDPLDPSAASREPVSENPADSPTSPAGTYASRRSSASVTGFFVRVRRSRGSLYKIPRLLFTWTVLILGVWGLIWIMFSVVGLR